MAYNSKNHHQFIQKVLAVYDMYKQPDLPDTYIVRVKFPEHDIHISYRTWMDYKGMKPSQLIYA